MATQFHNYQGCMIRKSHRTIYVESERECTEDELQRWMSHMADNDLDEYKPENGIRLSLGSEYHSKRTAAPD